MYDTDPLAASIAATVDISRTISLGLAPDSPQPVSESPDNPPPPPPSTGNTTASTVALPGISGVAAEAGEAAALTTAGLAAAILLATTTSTASRDQDEAQQTFYHGTTLSSATALYLGAPLDVGAVQQNTFNPTGSLAFFLAQNPYAAMYFGSLHATPTNPTTILQYTIANSALSTLISQGAIMGPIPQLGAPAPLPGLQLVIPPIAFPVFNSLRANGQIIVTPYNLR